MDLQISGRHVEVTDAIRKCIQRHVEGLPPYDEQIQYMSVTLGLDSGRQTAEIIAKFHKTKLIAEAQSHDMYECIERAFAKIERQTSRLHDKMVSHGSKAARRASKQKKTETD